MLNIQTIDCPNCGYPVTLPFPSGGQCQVCSTQLSWESHKRGPYTLQAVPPLVAPVWPVRPDPTNIFLGRAVEPPEQLYPNRLLNLASQMNDWPEQPIVESQPEKKTSSSVIFWIIIILCFILWLASQSGSARMPIPAGALPAHLLPLFF